MLKFYKILRFATVFVLFLGLGPIHIQAQSFSYTPTSLTLNPNGSDSAIGYVRIAYIHDSTWPGMHVRTWISSGGSYFSCTPDSTFTKSYFYCRVVYRTQTDTVYGTLSIEDMDSGITKTVALTGLPNPPAPAFTLEGPYFPSIPEGADTCVTMWIVNHNSYPDTLRGMTWSHNPNGIFTWDTVSLPTVLGAGDTAQWTFCFHAPDNTTTNYDTIQVYYGYNDAYISRLTYGVASSSLMAEGPYFTNDIVEGNDSCATMMIVNNSNSTDTIEGVTFSHNPEGIFRWDTASLPRTLGAHDTTYFTFCFYAPYNTYTNIDTINVSYHSSSGNGNVSRLAYATAAQPPSYLYSTGPYFNGTIPEGKDTCVTVRIMNTSSAADTITSVSWSHDPNGIFSWESVSLPYTLGAHDTIYWTFCFNAPQNTETYTDTLQYHYTNGNSSLITSRIVSAHATDTTPPDGSLYVIGPYFPQVVDEGHDTCTTVNVVNSGSDVDTITSAGWTHDPQGVFSWTSVSLPMTLGAHDTTKWTFCYDAPNDTELRVDTFMVHYHDAYNNDRYVMRIVSERATDASIVTCYGMYANSFPITNVGDTSEITLYIHNYLKHTSSLTACHISGTDDAAFRVDSSNFPLAIDSNAYGYVTLKFIPNRTSGSSSYSATLVATFSTDDTSHCKEAYVNLAGSMPQSCSDTATVVIDTTGVHDVDVTGDSVSYYAHRIDIVNNSNTTIVVSSVRFIDSSSHFYIYQTIPSTPDTLAPGKGMAVIIHFYGDTGQAYYDTLAITIQNGITIYGGKITPLAGPSTFYISVKGRQLAVPASVPLLTVSSADLELYPNPSSGEVTIQLDGAQTATYQVIDLLGNIIATHEGTGEWQFDSSTLQNGTYFVRAANGQIVTTKRLVVQK